MTDQQGFDEENHYFSRRVQECLARVPLFMLLPRAQRIRLASAFERINYRQGEILAARENLRAEWILKNLEEQRDDEEGRENSTPPVSTEPEFFLILHGSANLREPSEIETEREALQKSCAW